jgi:hypothetical protein
VTPVIVDPVGGQTVTPEPEVTMPTKNLNLDEFQKDLPDKATPPEAVK